MNCFFSKFKSIMGYGTDNYKDERGREYYFDNAKFILILLVVVAHAISPLKTNDPEIKTFWTFINAFHMPALIFISGYFAKGYIREDGTVKTKRLVNYIVYYLAAQIAVSLFEMFVLGDRGICKSLFNPRTSLWYLMCLIWWFVLLPYVDKLKPVYVLVGSVLLALIIGYDSSVNNYLSFCRVVNHFPIFMLGYYFKKDWLYKYRTKMVQIVSVVVLALIGVVMYLNIERIPTRIITSNYNYKNSDIDFLAKYHMEFMARFSYYILAIVMVAAFMLLVPRGKTFYTKLGARTLQVYILHRFLYLAELKWEWYNPFVGKKGFLHMILIGIIVTFVLSHRVFEIPFKYLSKLNLNWLLKEENNK